MVNFNPLFRKGQRFLSSKLGLTIALFILVVFFFLFFWQWGGRPFMRGSYDIGYDSRWREENLYGKEKNFTAFSRHILEGIAREEDVQFKMVSMGDNDLKEDLISGKVQGILSALKPNIFNQNLFVFSDIYFPMGPVLIIPEKKRDLEGWNELAKRIVGVYAYSPAILELQKDHNIRVKLYSDLNRALEDLKEGKIDGVIFPALPSYIYTSSFYEGQLKVVTKPLDDEGYRLVAMKNPEGEELIESFNKGLAILRKDGDYKEWITQWGLIDATDIKPFIPPTDS